jgi:hypothetical protein
MTKRKKFVTKVMITTLLSRIYCLENSALKMRAEYSLVAFLFPLKQKVFIIQESTVYTFIARENKVFPVDTMMACGRI